MAIVIAEFLANPVGPDKEGEYIALRNDGGEAASLNGYALADKSGKRFVLNGYSLGAGETKQFSSIQTKITLNNSDEEVLLYKGGDVVAQLTLSGVALEGVPTRRGGALTPELREKLFDNLMGQVVPQARPSGEVYVIWLVCALVLAVASVVIIRTLKSDEDHNDFNSSWDN